MYSLIYSIFYYLKRVEKKRRDSKKNSLKIINFILGYIEWFYNIPVRRWYEKFPSKKYGLNKKARKQKIIVSLTSYPKRIGTIWLTIETLLRQSYKPDMVILWLAESQFDGLDSLPKELLRLQDRGLTIRFCDDLRSHKKYFYALQEFKNDLIILADDDMFYPLDTIKKLMKLHKSYPNDICCISAQVIQPDFTASPSEWRNVFLKETNWQHSDMIQAYTGGGTLIPPNSIHRDVFDKDTFKEICLNADDLWLFYMAHRKGTKVTTLKNWQPFPITIYGTSEGSLYWINGEGNQNDVQWNNLINHYGV